MSLFEKLLKTELPKSEIKKTKGFSSEHPLIQEARILVDNVKNVLIKNKIKENTKEVYDKKEEITESKKNSEKSTKKPVKAVVNTKSGKII